MYRSSLVELAALLRQRKISSLELARYYLARITATQHSLNSVIAFDPEQTEIQARHADTLLATQQAGPLCGLPLLHKDIFVTREWPSTSGSRMLKGYRSPFDATIVARLKKAGMVCLGKSNLDEFAMGSATENSYYGITRNPWDLNCVPGGSSGGSAAAVAARIAPAATGSDTGGSIRQPASLCGITGIKPSYGIVSRLGMIAFASSLDQGGPMALTAQDCAELLNGMAGFDPGDSTSIEREPEDYTRFLQQTWKNDREYHQPLAGLTVGLPKEYFTFGLSAEVDQAVQETLKQWQNLGAKTVEVSLPETEFSIPVYYILACAEASSNLSRFDGVRYGYRCSDYENLNDMYERTRAEGFGWEVKRRIIMGTYVLSHGYFDAYYLQAQKIRRIIADDFQRAFQSCDVILGPVSPVVAWALGERKADPIQTYLADIYTCSASLAGLPGMSVPCAIAGNKPIGLQIIGNYFCEARMLQIAHIWQQHSDWHLRLPETAKFSAEVAK